jgi:DNA-binding NarL/FixJ family response regulator
MLTTTSANIHTHTIKVGFVDDFITGWAMGEAVGRMDGVETVLVARSGEEALQKLALLEELPDILVMDIRMKGLGGIQTTRLVTKHYPSIKTIALTAVFNVVSMIDMIGAGACGYFGKDIYDKEFKEMLFEVYHKRRYQADLYYRYRDNLVRYEAEEGKSIFTEAEVEYLKLVCKGYTIYQIAKIMDRSIHTLEYYRRGLYKKLRVNNFTLMVLDALRIGLIDLELFPSDY